MQEFKFGEKNKVEVKIEGKIYTVNYNEATLRAVDAMEKQYTKDLAALEKNGDVEKIFEKIETTARGVVDAMIGRGCFDEIFTDRGGYDVVEEMELMDYLLGVVREIQQRAGAAKAPAVILDEAQKKRAEAAMAAVVSEVDSHVAPGRRTAALR